MEGGCGGVGGTGWKEGVRGGGGGGGLEEQGEGGGGGWRHMMEVQIKREGGV